MNKPTAGTGHLLLSTENQQYKVGDIVPTNVLDEWLKKDSQKAWSAAIKQSNTLKITNLKFIESLASVNFQLGTGWRSIHKNTWKYLVQKDYDKAIAEVLGSLWFKQTPVRVKDFEEAIRIIV